MLGCSLSPRAGSGAAVSSSAGLRRPKRALAVRLKDTQQVERGQRRTRRQQLESSPSCRLMEVEFCSLASQIVYQIHLMVVRAWTILLVEPAPGWMKSRLVRRRRRRVVPGFYRRARVSRCRRVAHTAASSVLTDVLEPEELPGTRVRRGGGTGVEKTHRSRSRTHKCHIPPSSDAASGSLRPAWEEREVNVALRRTMVRNRECFVHNKSCHLCKASWPGCEPSLIPPPPLCVQVSRMLIGPFSRSKLRSGNSPSRKVRYFIPLSPGCLPRRISTRTEPRCLPCDTQLEAAIRRETETAKRLLAEGRQRQALLAIKKRKLSVCLPPRRDACRVLVTCRSISTDVSSSTHLAFC